MKLPEETQSYVPPLLQARRRVPNVQPAIQSSYRLAIIGEAPGFEEERDGRPFVGASGRFLSALLNATGINRAACFVGNICQYRPPGNDIKAFDWEGDEIQEGLALLREDLQRFQPNLVLLLGGSALRAAKGMDAVTNTRGNRTWRPYSISNWRGSLFRCDLLDSPFYGRKCLATFHPAAVLRVYEWAPLLRFDLRRAFEQSAVPTLSIPERVFDVDLSCGDIVDRLVQIGRSCSPLWLSFDLEGYWNRITRYSISTDPTRGFVVPLTAGEYGSYWSVDEECRIWQATSAVLTNSRIPKVLQNSLYDRFVLAYRHHILISNVRDDTMLGHWELYSELEKSLALQASVYTLEPYYKGDRDSDDLRTKLYYSAKDSAVTLDCRNGQRVELASQTNARLHYDFNVAMLDPLLYMELRGLNYDSTKAAVARLEVQAELWQKQHELNLAAGITLHLPTRKSAINGLVAAFCTKRAGATVRTFPGVLTCTYAGRGEDAARAVEILESAFAGLESDTAPLDRPLPPATLGELSSLLGVGLNVDSPKQTCAFLYAQRKFEPQWKEDKATGKKSLTSDVNACLNLYRKTEDPMLRLILEIRACLYKQETLGIRTDPDGRVRCGYNVVGTETGRITCYESPTGSGYNLQTVTKELRYLFRADPDRFIFQCDLAGADGWTVAAHSARLGDSTMLEDYRAGIKPAQVIALTYLHGREVLSWDRDHILREATTIKEGKGPVPWLYFACKRAQHGSNYEMKPPTMSKQILSDSYKKSGTPVYVPPTVCGQLQGFYLERYWGVPRWHDWVKQQLLAHGTLTSASGHTRRFFGRIRESDGRVNHETFKAALAEEPQQNTTYATNRAVLNLWTRPDNRIDGGGRFIAEPLHQVHDAILGQFPVDRVDDAARIIRSSFANPLTIAGQDITIPFEGNFGPSWGELNVGKI